MYIHVSTGSTRKMTNTNLSMRLEFFELQLSLVASSCSENQTLDHGGLLLLLVPNSSIFAENCLIHDGAQSMSGSHIGC